MGAEDSGDNGDCQHNVERSDDGKSGTTAVPWMYLWRNPHARHGTTGDSAEQSGRFQSLPRQRCCEYPANGPARIPVHTIHRPNHPYHPVPLSFFSVKRVAMETAAKPLLRALAGEPVWPPPIWLMRQAGRYLPEYRAIRAKVGGFHRAVHDPGSGGGGDAAADPPLSLRCGDPVQRHPDAALGAWPGPGVPRRRGTGAAAAARRGRPRRRCDPERIPAAIAPILETVRRVRCGPDATKAFTDCALIGFAGAPFTVACYMVEGGGSRDFAATRTMAYRAAGAVRAADRAC